MANDKTGCFWTSQPEVSARFMILSQILTAVPAGCEAQGLPRLQFAHSVHAHHQVYR
jgi:hypothetical protein